MFFVSALHVLSQPERCAVCGALWCRGITRGMALLADEWLNGVPSAVGQGTRTMARDIAWLLYGHYVDTIWI